MSFTALCKEQMQLEILNLPRFWLTTYEDNPLLKLQTPAFHLLRL
jgi:hypothetical protein